MPGFLLTRSLISLSYGAAICRMYQNIVTISYEFIGMTNLLIVSVKFDLCTSWNLHQISIILTNPLNFVCSDNDYDVVNEKQESKVSTQGRAPPGEMVLSDSKHLTLSHGNVRPLCKFLLHLGHEDLQPDKMTDNLYSSLEQLPSLDQRPSVRIITQPASKRSQPKTSSTASSIYQGSKYPAKGLSTNMHPQNQVSIAIL